MKSFIEVLRQCRDALETAKNGLAWYRDRCPDAVDGSDDEANTEIDEAITSADAALSATPAPAETVTLVGVKNGVETVLGEVPMPPNMKARELVREMFGAWEPDDGSDPDLAMAVCEQLIEWMGKQANASLAAPAPAQAVPLTERQVERIWLGVTDHGIVSRAIAIKLIRAVERAHNITGGSHG